MRNYMGRNWQGLTKTGRTLKAIPVSQRAKFAVALYRADYRHWVNAVSTAVEQIIRPEHRG